MESNASDERPPHNMNYLVIIIINLNLLLLLSVLCIYIKDIISFQWYLQPVLGPFLPFYFFHSNISLYQISPFYCLCPHVHIHHCIPSHILILSLSLFIQFNIVIIIFSYPIANRIVDRIKNISQGEDSSSFEIYC